MAESVEISKTGVFVDSKTGQVVEGQPEEGVQLVAPGSEVTDANRRDIEAARVAAAGGEQTPDVVTSQPDETTDEKPAASSRAAKKA